MYKHVSVPVNVRIAGMYIVCVSIMYTGVHYEVRVAYKSNPLNNTIKICSYISEYCADAIYNCILYACNLQHDVDIIKYSSSMVNVGECMYAKVTITLKRQDRFGSATYSCDSWHKSATCAFLDALSQIL